MMGRRKLTLRKLIATVAAAALILAVAGPWLASRRAARLTRASFHEREELAELRKLSEIEEARRSSRIGPGDRRYFNLERSCRLGREFHAEMAAKYRIAAGRPWSTVAPDRDNPGDKLATRLDSLIEDIPLQDFVLKDPPGPILLDPDK